MEFCWPRKECKFMWKMEENLFRLAQRSKIRSLRMNLKRSPIIFLTLLDKSMNQQPYDHGDPDELFLPSPSSLLCWSVCLKCRFASVFRGGVLWNKLSLQKNFFFDYYIINISLIYFKSYEKRMTIVAVNVRYKYRFE